MPRLRLSPLPQALLAGALLAGLTAALAGSVVGARAQTSPSLLSPQLDGNPKNQPTFQRPGAKRAELPSISTFQPASGAGTTGFDSSGKRKAKGKGKGKDKAKEQNKDRDKAGEEKAQGSSQPQSQPQSPPPQFPSPPSRYGSPTDNPMAPGPRQIAIPRLPSGVARRGASPYYVAPEVVTDVPLRRRVLPDDAPFDPTGIQVGAFNFKPAIEVTGGYDTNPARTQTPTPSLYSVVAPELKFNSNWARHEFTGDLRGSYYNYKDASTENRPTVDSKLNGRIDVTRDTRIDLETKFLVGTDNPGSPNIQAGLARLPIFTTWGGTAGIGHRFNRFDISLKSGVERTVYQDSRFLDGTTASNEDRDYNRYNVVLRGGYELTPGLKPYMEVGADRRIHDLDVDFFGFRRNSHGDYIKGGTTFEATPLITGDVAIGWLTRRFQDWTLPEISGLTVDGSLTWVASALTTVKLVATTRADESRVPGVSGSFTREVSLQVDHAFRRWLIATGKFLYGNDNYIGSDRDDNRFSVSAAITYKLTRELWLKSEYRHEWLRSSVPGANYDADVILVGLRAQR